MCLDLARVAGRAQREQRCMSAKRTSTQRWLMDGECLGTKKTIKLAFLLVRAHRRCCDACLHNSHDVFGFFD